MCPPGRESVDRFWVFVRYRKELSLLRPFRVAVICNRPRQSYLATAGPHAPLFASAVLRFAVCTRALPAQPGGRATRGAMRRCVVAT